MPNLSKQDQEKFEQMIQDWDDMARSIAFFVKIGKILGWIGGVAGAATGLWHILIKGH